MLHTEKRNATTQVLPNRCYTVTLASQRWQTIILRREPGVNKARAELRIATEPAKTAPAQAWRIKKARVEATLCAQGPLARTMCRGDFGEF